MRTQIHLVIRQKHPGKKKKKTSVNSGRPEHSPHASYFTAALQNSTLPCFKVLRFYALLKEISFLLPACKMAQSTQ